MTGHLSPAAAAGYAGGTLSGAAAGAADAHLERCGRCAARVSAAVRATPAGPALDRVRADLLTRAAAERPVPAAAPATAERPAPTGTPTGPGRTAAAAYRSRAAVAVRRYRRARPFPVRAVLSGAWVAGLLLVCAAGAVLAAAGGAGAARSLVLLAAPGLPVAGVALAHGPGADPMHAIAAATPAGGLRLLLLRTAAALAAAVPVLTAAGALLPGGHGVPGAAAWLLPGLALTALTLAVASFTGCRAAAALVGGGWAAAVALPVLAGAGGRAAGAAALARAAAGRLDGAGTQAGWAAGAVLCALLLAARRRTFDLGPGVRSGFTPYRSERM